MSAINFPLATTSLFVNTLTTNKIIYLPAASTVGAGRLFYIKDICGNAARSSIYISTIGMDRLENRFQPSTLYALMSTNYGSVLMAPDGALNWYFLQHYHRNAISSLGSGASAATGAFAPTSIATLVQWLDATDNTTVLTGIGGTIVANNGSAGYWGDKSGNNNYVTTNAVAPVYSTSLISSRAGLNFQNSAGMISPAFAKADSITLFLVGMVKSTRASWGTFWGHFTSGRHDDDIQLRYTDGSSHINWHTNNNNGSSQLPYTFDSPVLYSCTMSGGTVMFMQQTNTTGTTSVTVTEGTLTWRAGSAPVWIGRSDSNEVINSYISEIAYFQSVLSTADRQKMEGYLAWKYGLNTYLPAGHPHLSAPPGAFTPLTVSGIGLQVWLDGADPAGTGTAPADSASIATWTDKSGNGYNFTATSAATYSTANRAPYFNNNYYTSTYTAAPVTETGFVVFKLNSTAAPQIIIGANNGGREVSVANTFGDFGIIKSQVAWGQTVSGLTNSTTTLSTWQITSQTNTYISLNGALSLSGPTSIGTFTNGVTTGLGREATSSIPVFGWVMEIVMFNTQLSQTNQQKIEGYLAWKWGSQASLPAGHPYKSSAPTA
jgi:hypothetical protein